MIQASSNVLVYYPGDPVGEEANGAVKIALIGSDSYDPSGAFDWQQSMIDGIVELSNPTNGKGLIMYRNMRFAILNCKPANPPSNPNLDINNPEMVGKISSSLDFCNIADGIFLNFLKKSTAVVPLFEFGYLCQTQKMVVRCPDEYMYQPLVSLVCQRLNVPMFPGKMVNVLTILQALFNLPSIQQKQIYPLPE